MTALRQLTLGVINVTDGDLRHATVESFRWGFDEGSWRMACKRCKKEVVNGVLEECRMILKSLPYCMIFSYRRRVRMSLLPLSLSLYHELLEAQVVRRTGARGGR